MIRSHKPLSKAIEEMLENTDMNFAVFHKSRIMPTFMKHCKRVYSDASKIST